MQAQQMGLFGRDEPGIDERFSTLERIQLDASSWVDHVPAWVSGHQQLMDHLSSSMKWQHESMEIYDRTVDVPRLLATVPENGAGHPLLERMRQALARRYTIDLPHLSLALYRDGRDSVAFHGDRVARNMPEAIVITVSLGEPRRFLMRPREGGRSLAFALGWGDLMVMGGACQRTWQHGVPKVAHAGPRMVVMFRPGWYRV